jgi:5-methylcytosine-specific restriction endonuclease McrA
MKAIEKELDRMVQELHKNQRCHICGAYSATEIHHIISRKDKMLRYDISNLLPVCHSCHMKIHDKGLDEYQFLGELQAKYLKSIKNKSYKDFLIFEMQMTENEYLKFCKKRLKDEIANL